MTTQKRVTTEDLIFKLSEVLFSPESEQLIQVINKVEANANFNVDMKLEDYQKLSEAEQNAIFAKIAENTKGKNKEGVVEFTLDGERYELRHNTQENRIYFSHYKNKQEVDVAVKDILNKAVAKDIDSFKQDLLQISEECDVKQFVKTEEDHLDPFYNNIIASRNFQSVSIYLSDETLSVMSKLKSLFTADEQETIEDLVETKFAPPENNFVTELVQFFVEWTSRLNKGNHRKDNQLEFNDLDNHAYSLTADGYHMIVQESQNTIFAYILNTATYQIKVWNCADVLERDCEYEMNHYATYLDLMQYMGDPYSYYSFPVEMTGKTYPKSAEYYFKHFNDDGEFLVYDSNKGFRVNTYFSDCMATDVPLLTRVVNDLDDVEDEE